MSNPVRITIGSVGEANKDVQQIVEVLENDSQKWPWLSDRLEAFLGTGSVLIFVSTKAATEELARNLQAVGFNAQARGFIFPIPLSSLEHQSSLTL